MSGFAGLVHADSRRQVDPAQLALLVDWLAPTGPDGQATWIGGQVGFGHALLRTGPQDISQPVSLEGEVWLTGQMRLDDRANLLRELEPALGRRLPTEVPDAELLLWAYEAWGEQCVDHLLGDYAFAIWDGRREQLFCARDHFGVRSFYYALVDDTLVFSNYLHSLREYPGISDDLLETSVADFLVFGFNLELHTTIFADVRRLPPAHSLIWRRGKLEVKRYWQLSVDSRIRYRDTRDYVTHFRELLAKAVGDRLRSERVVVEMSGGVDSPAVAAVAQEMLGSERVHAVTQVYDRIIPDEERQFATMVARHLAISIDFLVADEHRFYEGWGRREWQPTDPYGVRYPISQVAMTEKLAKYSRVVLTGMGGDPIFTPARGYLRASLLAGDWVALLISLGRYVIDYGRVPPLYLGTAVRTWRARWAGQVMISNPFPSWLKDGLVERLDLRQRWFHYETHSAPPTLLHPEAYRSVSSPMWPIYFESNQYVLTPPVEFRHPFFDRRLVEYVLTIPPFPWSIHKELLRQSLEGYVPETVRRREKTTLPGNIVAHEWKQSVKVLEPLLSDASVLADYVDLDCYDRLLRQDAETITLQLLHPVWLALWHKQKP